MSRQQLPDIEIRGETSPPEGRPTHRKPPRRGPRNAWVHSRYRRARARLLDILIDRGIVQVDEADAQRLNEMPLGYWGELDDVDQAEWRRILELRLVGWRDFGPADRRPWRPA